VLEDAALIANERRGKQRFCRLNRETLARAQEWLDFNQRFWSGSLDRLDRHLKKNSKDKAT
jgi:DNA-binding transcriptional ArsR family regulator